MHGIIHVGLKRYVEARHGHGAWQAIAEEAGLGSETYLSTHTYPDAEAFAIVAAASRLTQVPADAILEDFGEFMAPHLLGMFRALIPPEWRTMEMLLHTEETIHRVVRTQDPGAHPPRLRFERIGPDRLRLHYHSPRNMSAVAKGIIKGVARHYGQTVAIAERTVGEGVREMIITIA